MLRTHIAILQINHCYHHRLCFKVVLQTLLGSPYAVQWPSILHCRVPGVTFQKTLVGRHSIRSGLLWTTGSSHPLHHQSSTCLHTIGIALSFYMTTCHLSLNLLITSHISYTFNVFGVQCWVVFLPGKHHTST